MRGKDRGCVCYLKRLSVACVTSGKIAVMQFMYASGVKGVGASHIGRTKAKYGSVMAFREQMDHLEKAESLTRQALFSVCGKTGDAGKLPVDAGDALERLKAVVTRQLTQAKDGAAGFKQAVAEELQELTGQAKAVDLDIKVTRNQIYAEAAC